jgi:hypothetical protein
MSGTMSLSVPAMLRSFADPSGLPPGEDRRDFEAIRQAMIDDIQPETNLEWLWIFDLVVPLPQTEYLSGFSRNCN